jgi:acyl-CoA hydrolase
MTPKKASESESHMGQIVAPGDLNMHGNLFGGGLLSIMDRTAAMAAMRHSRRNCVTVSIDKVDFVAPVRMGFLLEVSARVHFTARTSMEIYVGAIAENPLTGDKKTVCEAFFSFVALDGDNQPTAIPQVELETDADKTFNAEAKARYEARKQGKLESRTRILK